jgi:hypothetical protein
MVQFSGMFDPGDALPIKGLSLGGRYVTGGDSRGMIEPLLRYRSFLDDDERVAIAATGFGTNASGEAKGASFKAIRGGAEVAIDVRVTPKHDWIQLHLTGGASLTLIKAEGDYCMSPEGYGESCGDERIAETHVDTFGAYPAILGGLYVDLMRRMGLFIHTVRIGAYFAGGLIPRVRQGKQESHGSWFSGGLNLIVGLGAPAP